jgi:hypothetical protein
MIPCATKTCKSLIIIITQQMHNLEDILNGHDCLEKFIVILVLHNMLWDVMGMERSCCLIEG